MYHFFGEIYTSIHLVKHWLIRFLNKSYKQTHEHTPYQNHLLAQQYGRHAHNSVVDTMTQ